MMKHVMNIWALPHTADKLTHSRHAGSGYAAYATCPEVARLERVKQVFYTVVFLQKAIASSTEGHATILQHSSEGNSIQHARTPFYSI